MIIHINGWPGVGKKTVAQLVSRQLGARFIHNHLLHDVAIACVGFQNPLRWQLYEKVRAAAYEALAARPQTEIFVMTNALCIDSERERFAWDQVVELAMLRGVPLVPVVLETTLEENIRRLTDAKRDEGKLKNETLLSEFRRTDKIQMPDVNELLVIDATSLEAVGAAEIICDHITKLAPQLKVADARHKMLKPQLFP